MDKIIIEGMEIDCIIGIFDWERKTKQKVILDVQIEYDSTLLGDTDDIQNAVDYKSLNKSIVHYVANSTCRLLETLAEKVSGLILAIDKVYAVRLKVSKPNALSLAKNVAVEIYRAK